MNPHSFRGKIRRAPAFTDELRLNGRSRQFDVFTWENRLVAHETETDFWWATLDPYTAEDPEVFWRECVETERVGRTFSAQLMFPPLSKNNGARVSWSLSWYDLIVARDNSGLARLEGTPQWHAFSGLQPKKLSKPGAYRPTIWSPQFSVKFGYQSMKGLHSVFTAQQIARLSPSIQTYWQEGVNSRPLRLVGAAVALGWMPTLRQTITIEQYWRSVLKRRAVSSDELPQSLLESPDFFAPGLLNWRGPVLWPTPTAVFFTCQQHDISLAIEFPLSLASAHERLEARLELRDWLVQFFPLAQVEAWFETS